MNATGALDFSTGGNPAYQFNDTADFDRSGQGRGRWHDQYRPQPQYRDRLRVGYRRTGGSATIINSGDVVEEINGNGVGTSYQYIGSSPITLDLSSSGTSATEADLGNTALWQLDTGAAPTIATDYAGHRRLEVAQAASLILVMRRNHRQRRYCHHVFLHRIEPDHARSLRNRHGSELRRRAVEQLSTNPPAAFGPGVQKLAYAATVETKLSGIVTSYEDAEAQLLSYIDIQNQITSGYISGSTTQHNPPDPTVAAQIRRSDRTSVARAVTPGGRPGCVG